MFRGGGYNSINATIDLMKTALEAGDFDRFIILQGLEYPILSNKQIEKFLEQHHDTEFIKAQNTSISTEARKTHKYRLFYYFDKRHIRAVRYLHRFNQYLLRKNMIIPFKRNYVKNNHGEKMQIFQGCAQFGLTKKAVEYIVQFHDNNPRFNRYFKSMFAADEAYFHTILYNSDFISKTIDGGPVDVPTLSYHANLTYFEYPGYTIEIKIFKEKEDYQRLRDTGKLFFRKATSDSSELLDYIDQIHKEET